MANNNNIINLILRIRQQGAATIQQAQTNLQSLSATALQVQQANNAAGASGQAMGQQLSGASTQASGLTSSIHQLSGTAAPAAGSLSTVGSTALSVGDSVAMARLKMLAFAASLALIGGKFLDAFQSAGEFERQIKRLEALIKATGGAAGFTANQVSFLADELDRMTLAGADEARDAAGVLLTFKSVTGDLFREALTTAQDLSETLGSSLTGAVTQLGKALEDPVAGISALKESGVSFTAAEKEMITTLVETNNVAAAQSYIMKTLAGQVGGAATNAATGYAGAVDGMGFAWTNFKRTLTDSSALEAATALVGKFTKAIQIADEYMGGAGGDRNIIGARLVEDWHDLREQVEEIERAITEESANPPAFLVASGGLERRLAMLDGRREQLKREMDSIQSEIEANAAARNDENKAAGKDYKTAPQEDVNELLDLARSGGDLIYAEFKDRIESMTKTEVQSVRTLVETKIRNEKALLKTLSDERKRAAIEQLNSDISAADRAASERMSIEKQALDERLAALKIEVETGSKTREEAIREEASLREDLIRKQADLTVESIEKTRTANEQQLEVLKGALTDLDDAAMTAAKAITEDAELQALAYEDIRSKQQERLSLEQKIADLSADIAESAEKEARVRNAADSQVRVQQLQNQLELAQIQKKETEENARRRQQLLDKLTTAELSAIKRTQGEEVAKIEEIDRKYKQMIAEQELVGEDLAIAEKARIAEIANARAEADERRKAKLEEMQGLLQAAEVRALEVADKEHESKLASIEARYRKLFSTLEVGSEAYATAEKARAQEVANAQAEAAKKQLEEQKAIQSEITRVRIDLLRAQGQGVAAANLEIENQYADLVEKLGKNSEEAQLVEKLINVKKAKAQMAELDRELSDLISKHSRGQISNDEFSQGVDLIGGDLREAAGETGDPADLDQVNEKLSEAYMRVDLLGQIGKTVGESLSNSLVDSLFAFIDGTKSAGDAFRDFAAGVLRDIAKMMMQQAILNALQGAFGGASGGFGGGVMASIFHGGGTAGSGSRKRFVSPSLFALAPRYHTGGIAGLAPNEVPAILEKGERVMTEAEQKEMARNQGQGGNSATNVTVNNMIDSQSVAAAMDGSEGENTVMNHIKANASEIKALFSQ